LPKDVRVWALGEAPAGFNARFSAVWRRYAYRVTDNPGGVDPLLRSHVLWHDWPLDVDAMNEAAGRLLGEHDFAAYCKKREGATTIRTLQELRLERGDDGVVTATVRADAFCHNMVRSLIGALLFVGDGHRGAEWPAKVLAAGVRDSAVHVVRPHGLTLEEVGYPADELLAARNLEARNRRSLPAAGCC
jgi:tRNA pseudouridine38-40 synthase